jgi:gliding motility-associated-like protein
MPDGDGDKDLFLGAANGNVYYFKRTGQTSFEEQTGSNNPFNGINKGANSSPSAADFDNDGDADVILGADNLKLDIFYFENKGNSIFEEKTGFASPFGGTTIDRDASPYFVDLDTDGDQDLLIGNSDNTAPFLRYFKNVNGKYVEETANNPFNQALTADRFVPSFIDLDGDGDKDLVGSVDNSDMTWIEYFKNENGAFVLQDFETGPFSTIAIDDGRSEFGDIDNDGDFDLFVAERDYPSVNPIYFIRFFKNTGTAQSPVFTELNGTDNPLNQVLEDFELLPRLIDIDHDGDLDALIGEGGGVVETSDGNEFSYYENTGTLSTPSFTYRGDLLDQGTNPFGPAPSFVDQDNDGDLDLFVGSVWGQLSFYKNVNPAAVATVTSGNLTFLLGSNAVVVDPLLQLTDADNDSIVFASVSISPYETGKETLTFTTQAGITGTFDSGAGILTFRGKAPVSAYQALLKSVAYQYTALDISTGRKRNPKLATLPRTLTFLISDADGTSSAPVSKNITVISGQPPVFNDASINLFAGASATVDLSQLISDADGDINLNSLSIVQPLLSGAVTSIAANGNLSISYQSLAFTGVETLLVQVCDADNNCDQSTITVNVTNTAPVFNDQAVAVSFEGQGSLNLVPLISDAESNIDLSSVTIIQNPTSGASATIEIISATEINLVLDYTGITFSGTDQVTISVCDRAGACSESVVSVSVDVSPPSSITVFNAVAPKSTFDNRFLRIENLPAANKVTIFNRWGDVVFEKDKYDNDQRKFEGLNQNGHILPSGTYFYQIEFSDDSNKRQTLTGYLSLKQ